MQGLRRQGVFRFVSTKILIQALQNCVATCNTGTRGGANYANALLFFALFSVCSFECDGLFLLLQTFVDVVAKHGAFGVEYFFPEEIQLQEFY